MSKSKAHFVPRRHGYRTFNDYPVPLQEHPGAPMEIARVSIPGWLSQSEADRICRVVQALAVPDDQVASLWETRTEDCDDPARHGDAT